MLHGNWESCFCAAFVFQGNDTLIAGADISNFGGFHCSSMLYILTVSVLDSCRILPILSPTVNQKCRLKMFKILWRPKNVRIFVVTHPIYKLFPVLHVYLLKLRH